MEGNFFLEILDIAIRSFVAFVVLFLLTKMLGNKQIAQLSFFDYVIGISIGSIAAAFAVDRTIDYAHAIVSLILYATFAFLLSLINLKSVKFRELIGGTPKILIQNGKLIEKNLRKSRYSVNDVLEECRIRGAYNIADVEFAILETCGQISILLKSQKTPVTNEDLNIETDYRGICADLIIDGVIMHKHLRMLKLDEKWLMEQLNNRHILSHKDVLLANLDTSGNLLIDLKGRDPEPLDIIE